VRPDLDWACPTARAWLFIDRAVEEGFKVLDTADMYTGGNSERVVGTWNRTHPDAGIFIQTKTGITPDGPDLSPDRVARQLEHSIAVLGRVDLYVAHQVEPEHAVGRVAPRVQPRRRKRDDPRLRPV